MSVHYGRHAYLLCDARREHGPCRAYHLPPAISQPFAAGDILVHQLDARLQAETLGWQAFPPEGPHFCPEHKPPDPPGGPAPRPNA